MSIFVWILISAAINESDSVNLKIILWNCENTLTILETPMSGAIDFPVFMFVTFFSP